MALPRPEREDTSEPGRTRTPQAAGLALPVVAGVSPERGVPQCLAALLAVTSAAVVVTSAAAAVVVISAAVVLAADMPVEEAPEAVAATVAVAAVLAAEAATGKIVRSERSRRPGSDYF